MNTSTFALIFGIAYLGAGLLGLIPAALIPPPVDAPPTHFTLLYGYLLGLFPVNVLHSAVHLAIGAWGLAAWRGMAEPRVYARALTLLYGALAVLGLMPGMNTLFGVLPIHGHDVWLHAGTAAVAAYFGWRSEVQMDRRTVTPDRRLRMLPVARERRLGLADRRSMAYSGV
jgi:Domain of unknown function (DUF4383)